MKSLKYYFLLYGTVSQGVATVDLSSSSSVVMVCLNNDQCADEN